MIYSKIMLIGRMVMLKTRRRRWKIIYRNMNNANNINKKTV